MIRSFKQSERGQALSETAIAAPVVILIIAGFLTLLPLHRARTAATAAAYGCAQFLSQSPDTRLAEQNAVNIAWDTLDAAWSATLFSDFDVDVQVPLQQGAPGTCTVRYRVPLLLGDILGADDGGWISVSFTSRSEVWKARWH